MRAERERASRIEKRFSTFPRNPRTILKNDLDVLFESSVYKHRVIVFRLLDMRTPSLACYGSIVC